MSTGPSWMHGAEAATPEQRRPDHDRDRFGVGVHHADAEPDGPGRRQPAHDVVGDRRAGPRWGELTGGTARSTVAGGAPSWRGALRPGRRVRVVPGIARPAVLTLLATLGWLPVAAFGVLRLHQWWSLAALGAGLAALALAASGFRILGLLPVLLGAAAWGMATGDTVPESHGDLVGVVRLLGWNMLYPVPLLIAYGLATWVDARRDARDRVHDALGQRRWRGSAQVADAEPRLAELEELPAARFFMLPDGTCPHLVTAGRRAVVVRATVWPRGEYTMTEVGEILRNGRPFMSGCDDLDGVVADVRGWSARLGTDVGTVRGFLVVHPPREQRPEQVLLDIGETRGVRVVAADRFVEVAGDFLAAEAYRIDVALTERLAEQLPVFETS